ncbi:dihydroneopterin aldolase [soil metagenome]
MRSAADGDLPDHIMLEGMQYYGYHGVNPEERMQGQRFLVDVTLFADLRRAGISDDLTETINYSEVYRDVREIAEGEPRNLIEAVAGDIASRLLDRYPLASSVTVTVRKSEAPIKGSFLTAAGVTIHRNRDAEQS